MLNQETFLRKYNIEDETFDQSGLVWNELEEIYADYEGKQEDLLVTGNMIAGHLQKIKEVHSLKIRVKDPEHLIEKIIRKKIKEPERELTLETYQSEITDLIGVRGLHLFKDDWVLIHKAICETWELHEPPKANIRKGDSETVFTDNDCEVLEHEHGYRSVHYLVTSKPTKNEFIAEIQIRTIFEEGWSEIDHKLRYPYDTNNSLLTGYLAVFNRLAGNADEMGTFIKDLKIEIENYQNQLLDKNQELDEKIKELESLQETVEMKDAEKEKLQSVIDGLKSSYTASSTLGSSGGLTYAASSTQKCENCGTDIPFSVFGSKRCAVCSSGFTVGSSGGLTYAASSTQKCENCGTDIPFSILGSKRCAVCSLLR